MTRGYREIYCVLARKGVSFSVAEMEEHDLEIEKARLLSLASDFGFDEDASQQCLDRLIRLYGEDGRDFITVEHCGDDYLAALAESMAVDEDWDDLQAMETEACGALNNMLANEVPDDSDVGNEDVLENCSSGKAPDRGRMKMSFVLLDSASDSDEPDFEMSKRSCASTQMSDKRHSKSRVNNSLVQMSLLLALQEYLSFVEFVVNSARGLIWNLALEGIEVVQALDDIELANVVIFGNRTFRPLQYEACKAAMAKRDSFILMPTGGGKSLCYQLPATLHPGVTVVICPLLSLIQDQIVKLNLKFGIPATFLNSQQTASQASAVIRELRQGSIY
ncbi:hypothetical protein ACLOJK_026391 [Asimina triloba]